MDPAYFFQVKDCPFGGTLPLMINWQSARAHGSQLLAQVFINGRSHGYVAVLRRYLWSVPLNVFRTPDHGPGRRLLPPAFRGTDLAQLLARLAARYHRPAQCAQQHQCQTLRHPVGSHRDRTRHRPRPLRQPYDRQHASYRDHRADLPTARKRSYPTRAPLSPRGAPIFTFEITASAPAHFLGWSLTAYWGDNKSKAVASDSYSNHISPSRIWIGISAVQVPPPGPTPWNASVSGDPTSTHCAHSFFLYAWDRVINGWGYIHGPASYSKSHHHHALKESQPVQARQEFELVAPHTAFSLRLVQKRGRKPSAKPSTATPRPASP